MAAPPPAKKRINRRWTPHDDLRLVRALAADRVLVKQLVYPPRSPNHDPNDGSGAALADDPDPDQSVEQDDDHDPDDASSRPSKRPRHSHSGRPQYKSSNRAMYSVLGELASGTPVSFSASAVRSRITTLKKWYSLYSSGQIETLKDDIAGAPHSHGMKPSISPPSASAGPPQPGTQSPLSAPASASAPSPSAAGGGSEVKRVPIWFDTWHRHVASGLQAGSLQPDLALDSPVAVSRTESGCGSVLGPAMGHEISGGSNGTPTLTLPPLPGLSPTPASGFSPTPPSSSALNFLLPGAGTGAGVGTGVGAGTESGIPRTLPRERERDHHQFPQLSAAYDRRVASELDENGSYESPHAAHAPPPAAGPLLLYEASGDYDFVSAATCRPTSPLTNGNLAQPQPPPHGPATFHPSHSHSHSQPTSHPPSHPPSHPNPNPNPHPHLHSHSHTHPHTHSHSHQEPHPVPPRPRPTPFSHLPSRSHSLSFSSHGAPAPASVSPHTYHAHRPAPDYPDTAFPSSGYAPSPPTSATRRGEHLSPQPPPQPQPQPQPQQHTAPLPLPPLLPRTQAANPDRIVTAPTLPAPAAPLADGGFSAHLVALEPEAYMSAIAHPFLTAAAARTLPSEQIEAWLAQDRLYAGVGYLRFAGLMLARLPTLADGEGSALACTYGARIRAVLSGAISNVVREVQFFEDTAAHWGLDLGGDSTSLMAPYAPVTQAYCLYMLEVGQTGSPEEQMTLLWAMEKLYLEAWTTAASGQQAAAVGPPRGGELGGAAHVLDLFVQNWTCGAFRAFVTELGSLLDAIVPLDATPTHVKARCEAVWRRVLWFERYFWDAGRTATDER